MTSNSLEYVMCPKLLMAFKTAGALCVVSTATVTSKRAASPKPRKLASIFENRMPSDTPKPHGLSIYYVSINQINQSIYSSIGGSTDPSIHIIPHLHGSARSIATGYGYELGTFNFRTRHDKTIVGIFQNISRNPWCNFGTFVM